MSTNLELDKFNSMASFLQGGIDNKDFEYVAELPLADIYPDEEQPRFKNLTEEGVQDLIATIKSAGRVLQPIIVRPKDENGHKIYMGGRRYLASKILGKETIPAIITNEENFNSVMLVQLIENEARKNLDAIELGKAFVVLKSEGFTQKEIAKQLGKTESVVAECLMMVELDDNLEFDFLKELFDTGKCKDTSTLAALIRLAKKDNAKTRNIVSWAVEQGTLTRSFVKSLTASKFNQPIEEIFSVEKLGVANDVNINKTSENSIDKDLASDKSQVIVDESFEENVDAETADAGGDEDFSLEQEVDGISKSDPQTKKVTEISVQFNGKIGRIIMDKVSDKDGYAFVICDNDVVEVDVAELSLMAVS